MKSSSFENFDSTQWTTLYGFTADPVGYELDHAAWPEAAVLVYYSHLNHLETIDMDGATFTLGSEETVGGVNYKSLIVSNANWSIEPHPLLTGALFVNVGNIGNEDSATNASGTWPVILKPPPEMMNFTMSVE